MTVTSRIVLLFVGLSVAAVGACASDDGAKKGGSASAVAVRDDGAVRITDESFDSAGLSRRDLDLNRDGTPDAYQFVRIVDGNAVIVRKEIDVNFDKKIDVVRILDEKGDLVSERHDSDFDGRVDVVLFFEKGAIVRKEYDTNFDQRADMWRYFDKGVIARRESDLNYDGSVDVWEYYEAGALDRRGFDRNGDGTVDEWESKDAG
jgi:hypothetical protein